MISSIIDVLMSAQQLVTVAVQGCTCQCEYNYVCLAVRGSDYLHTFNPDSVKLTLRIDCVFSCDPTELGVAPVVE